MTSQLSISKQQLLRTLLLRIPGLQLISPNKDRAKSRIFKVLLFHSSQSAVYPKLCILTELNSTFCGNHSFGQKCWGSSDNDHVFREPPPRPWTKMKSITGSWGSWRILSPSGPLMSLKRDWSCSLVSGAAPRDGLNFLQAPFTARSRRLGLSVDERLLF